MRIQDGICKLAVVQAEPALFDTAACVEKVLEKLEEAAAHGAQLIVFPELFIPGYPYGMTFGFATGKRSEAGRKDWKRYADASVVIGGEETEAIVEKVKEYKVWVSLGLSERDPVSGTLYNSNIFISPDGEVTLHRKLKPTGQERCVWGDADKDYFPVVETPWGPMGCMICWESYMPLARMALYKKGISLYISCNTNDNAEWQHTIRHIALEGRCYVVNCDMIITKNSYPKDLATGYEVAAQPKSVLCRGGSCVIDPFGRDVSETVWDMERIIYADLDMSKVPASRMEFDPCGHYGRADVFSFGFEDK